MAHRLGGVGDNTGEYLDIPRSARVAVAATLRDLLGDATASDASAARHEGCASRYSASRMAITNLRSLLNRASAGVVSVGLHPQARSADRLDSVALQ